MQAQEQHSQGPWSVFVWRDLHVFRALGSRAAGVRALGPSRAASGSMADVILMDATPCTAGRPWSGKVAIPLKNERAFSSIVSDGGIDLHVLSNALHSEGTSTCPHPRASLLRQTQQEELLKGSGNFSQEGQSQTRLN